MPFEILNSSNTQLVIRSSSYVLNVFQPAVLL